MLFTKAGWQVICIWGAVEQSSINKDLVFRISIMLHASLRDCQRRDLCIYSVWMIEHGLRHICLKMAWIFTQKKMYALFGM